LPPAIREPPSSSSDRISAPPTSCPPAAENRGLTDEKLAMIVAGQRPVDLTRQDAVAYDVAAALVSGGVLPELTYRATVTAFGPHGPPN
jgi:hypothetical protein